ncbi:GDSL lipase/acylhydrolase [Infundibulicybe gibba]|nr:GDSL lipase/acylhydrolase [Infundibulicybe gibba]
MKFPSTPLWCTLVSTLLSPALGALRPKQIKNLVTFGDSYTDVVSVGDGGVAWPVYAAGYASLSLFPFARSGATCSNNITFRPFPSVFESQLPLYFAEAANGTVKLNPEETLYTLWIGTNDLGVNALITGSDDASIVDVAECMVNWVRALYASGARNFLFQNMIPLQLVTLYSANSYPNRFWAEPRNTTDWSVLMTELVLSGNALTKGMLQALAPTLRGAHIGLFDSHSLFNDMFTHPALYLNGTAPLNVTGSVNACVFVEGDPSASPVCTVAHGTDKDSFLWFDELHPSEQADRKLAEQIAQVAEGKENRWTTWLS